MPRAAARPSRPGGLVHGVLPVQQYRRGRGRGHAKVDARPRPGRRLGRASRQRHAGYVLGGFPRRLSVDPSLAVLSRHRLERRNRHGRRAGHDAQPADRIRHAARRISASVPRRAGAIRRAHSAAVGHGQRRLRQPRRRSGRFAGTWKSRTSSRSPMRCWILPTPMPAAGWSASWRGATTPVSWPAASKCTCGAC